MSGARPDTWMPMYWGDYLKDTMHLRAEQHGAYLLLIGACWTKGGSLPNDDDQLAAITRLDARAWQKHKAVLLAFFTKEGDVLKLKRVTKELERSQAITQKRAETGKAGAAKRWRTDSKPDGKDDGKPPPEKWESDGPSQSQSQRERILDVGRLVSGAARPQRGTSIYADPANRLARHQQKVFDEVNRRLPGEQAVQVVAEIAAQTPEGKRLFEQYSAIVKSGDRRKNSASQAQAAE